MKKLLFLYFLVFKTLLFGCAACQLMNPTAEVNIKLNVKEHTLNKMHVTWTFSDVYSTEVFREYDKNKNDKLDDKEFKTILKAMLDYALPKKMLTKLKYANENEISKEIKVKYENFKIELKGICLVLSYDAMLKQNIKDNSTLSFLFRDDEGYLNFAIKELNIFPKSLHHEDNLYIDTAFILFNSALTKEEVKKPIQELPSILEIEKQQQLKEKEQKKTKSTSTQENLLKESILKVKSLFQSIKDEKNPLTYILLLAFAYLYGLIHALGPGHGKTLVASYFLSNEKSYSRALFVSLAIGVVHTFSAFLLTLIIYFAVNSFLSGFLNDTVFYTTKISALIIISIALYLLYQKYRAYKKIAEAKKQPSFNFSTTPHTATCSCSACKVDEKSTDAALIISAGIIPCPGTVTIFIFSLSLGLYYAGFLSALVMSLGMSTIIFFSAVLSVAVRKKTTSEHANLKKYLEYGSLFVILILGTILLFS